MTNDDIHPLTGECILTPADTLRERILASIRHNYRDETPTEQEARAQRIWDARVRAAAVIDRIAGLSAVPPCALVWPDHREPEAFRTWDLYCLDDYDYVAATPPGSYHSWTERLGCCNVDEVELPNGWTLHVGYHS